MRKSAALAMSALVMMLPLRASAACGFKEFPSKSIQLEAGASISPLTKGRGTWNEADIFVLARNGARSTLLRVASDTRFAMTDTAYEGAAYGMLGTRVIANANAAFSPQHHSLAASSLGGGLDVRSGGGYGYQVQYSDRSYTAVNAATTSVGADRYFRDRRVALGFSLAQLSGVPGTAFSSSIAYARYLPCDSESLSVSNGRDVENSRPGMLAVYRSMSYSAGDVHWLSKRFAVNASAGWYVLLGAYNRYEVRVALRERL
ncbi:MAG: YaiO family outer membrane beta-barrel protein [Candidatus Baltobacteraceae bacterium]